MLTVQVADEFTERYLALPLSLRKKVRKQEILFRENPFHPSLNTEKLEPKGKQMWSFRVDHRYRVLFRFEDRNLVTLLTVGPHDWIYKIAL